MSARVWYRTPLLVLVTLLALEGLLQLGAAVWPRVSRAVSGRGPPAMLEDERLRHRPNPEHPDHDASGFRNAERPERADVVAIGDSQTYGVGVSREQAWPQQLADASGRAVYNLAFGGYGPGHYLVLAEDGLALHPELLVVAFYAGNDLAETWRMVGERGQLPELDAMTPERRARALRAQEQRGGHGEEWLRTREALGRGSDRSWMAKLQLLRMLRRVGALLDPRPPPAPLHPLERIARADPGLFHVVAREGIGTVLTPRQRLAVVDLGDPRIEEALVMSLAAFERIRERARASGAELLVLLIPTKERVFEPLVRGEPEAPDALAELLRNEARVWDRLAAGLDARGIAWVDALPALRDELARGSSPYPNSDDGHPNAAGQRRIAEVVGAAISGTLR